MKKMILFCVLILINLAYAHSGRTNSKGCHNDRKNGGYHCHNSDSDKSKDLVAVAAKDNASTKSNKTTKTSKEIKG